jgi:predicted Zn-dependent peptidase
MRAPLVPWVLAVALAGPLGAEVQAFQSPGGMRCLLVEKHDQPLIRCELTVAWNPQEEPRDRAGLAGLLATTMRAGGAGPLSRPEFSRSLDDLGVVYAFGNQRHAFHWTLVAESRSQEPAMELLAHAVFRPVFDAALVDAQRGVFLEEAPEGASTWTKMEARFLWSLGDAATVRPPAADGLRSATWEEVQAFRRRVLRPEAATLVLYGDLNLAQAKELVFLHFGLWSPGPQGPLAAAGPGPAPEPALGIALEGTLDSECWAGRETTGVDPAVRELLRILLEQGEAVAAPGVLISTSLGPGQPLLVKAKAEANGRGQLVKALSETLERLRNRGFSERDLERARLRWNARRNALPLHPQDYVAHLRDGTLTPEFQRQVEAVQLRDLNKVLAEILDPASLRFLLLGADDRLVAQAKQAGLVRP